MPTPKGLSGEPLAVQFEDKELALFDLDGEPIIQVPPEFVKFHLIPEEANGLRDSVQDHKRRLIGQLGYIADIESTLEGFRDFVSDAFETIRGEGADTETLSSIRTDLATVEAVLSVDDSTLDSAQERVERLQQLAASLSGLDVDAVGGLRAELDLANENRELLGEQVSGRIDALSGTYYSTVSIEAAVASGKNSYGDAPPGAAFTAVQANSFGTVFASQEWRRVRVGSTSQDVDWALVSDGPTERRTTLDIKDSAVLATRITTLAYDEDDHPNSGATWVSTGEVVSGKRGLNDDGMLYDVAGRQFKFSGVPCPEQFGANGSDDSQAFRRAAAATTSNKVRIIGEYRIGSTCELPRIHFQGLGGTILGFAGRGFSTAGEISLYGQITFDGFEGAERESSGAECHICAIRLLPGSKISHLRVDRGVKFIRCRGGVRACQDDEEDYRIDREGSIEGGWFSASSDLTGQGALLLRLGRIGEFEVRGGAHLRTIGNGREVCPINIYIDGIAPQAPQYQMHGNIRIIGTLVDTVINRTINGTSQGSGNFETCGLRVSGHDVTVANNILVNVTGNELDCEGIYTKAVRSKIVGNILMNSGTTEAAINVKGLDPANLTLKSPNGHLCDVSGNTIFFDQYFVENGGVQVAMRRSGIHVSAPAGCSVHDNKVIGANEVDVMIDCVTGSQNAGCSVTSTRSYLSRSNSIVRIRGGIHGLNVNDTRIVYPKPTDSFLKLIDLVDPGERGIDYKGLDFSGGSILMSSESYSGTVNGLWIDGGYKPIHGLQMDGWNWDVDAPNATIRPIQMSSAESQEDRIVKGFKFRHWDFAQPLKEEPVSWGSVKPQSIDIDLTWKVRSLDANPLNIARVILNPNCGGLLRLTASSVKDGFSQHRQYHRSTQMCRRNAGNSALVGTPAITTTGSAPECVSRYAISGESALAQLVGYAGTVDWRVRFQAEIEAP